MRVKNGASLKDLTPQAWFAIGVVNGVVFAMGLQPAVITSGRRFGDGKSKHDHGQAIDIRVKEWSKEETREVLNTLQVLLNPMGYDVVDETNKPGAPHIHVEFDPKSDEQFIQYTP